MLKKLIEKSLAVVIAALAIFGFLCAWALWSLLDAQPAGEVCSCGSGVQCTGSRGGKFCVDESGNKRYK